MIFSKYKNIFGEPGKGVHSYRILNTPIVDYLGTLVMAAIISYFSGVSLTYTTLTLLVLAIIFHYLFGVI